MCQVAGAAARLKGLLDDLEGRRPDADELEAAAAHCAFEVGREGAVVGGDNCPSREVAVKGAPPVENVASSAPGGEVVMERGGVQRGGVEQEPEGAGGDLREKFDGVDLNGVKRIVGMKVADETKMKALAKLFEKEPRLLALIAASTAVGETGSVSEPEVWDARAGAFASPPNWEEIAASVEAIETSRRIASSMPGPAGVIPDKGGPGDGSAQGTLGGEGHPVSHPGEDQASVREQATNFGREQDGLRRLHEVLTLDEAKWLRSTLLVLLGADCNRDDEVGGTESSKMVLLGVGRAALEELLCLVEAFEALLQPGVAAALDVPGAVGFLHFRSQVLLRRRRLSAHQGKSGESLAPTTRGDIGERSMSGDDRSRSSVAVCSGQAEKIMSDPPLGCIALCMPCHSDTQDTILGVAAGGGESAAGSFGGEVAGSGGAVPPDLCEQWLAFSPGLWVKSTAHLRALVEQVARARYQRRQEPMDAALWYVLARRTRQLSALFKAKGDGRVAAFLLRDFEGDESARASAYKNAFSLLAKHQTLGALAFFVLACRIEDAINLLVINLGDVHLAVLLVRLAATCPQQATALLTKLVHETVLPLAEARQDRGMLHLALWLLSRPAAAAAALWIRQPSTDHLTSVETRTRTARAPGLLSRLTAQDDAAQSAAVEEVGDAVHPAVVGLLEALHERYRHLRGVWVMVPDGELRVAAARALLDDGCSALAASLLASLCSGRTAVPGAAAGAVAEGGARHEGWAVAGAQVSALCFNVCLAQAAALIRAEGSRHASTGQNQVDLTGFKRQLTALMAALDVDLGEVTPLLVRFALNRGFWRLGHALVTGSWQGSNTSHDSALACVAVHPLTSSLAGSIADFTADDVLSEDGWPASALSACRLSAIERKGKFLQLILHGLTVANDGNTGALAILASCVMMTHFVLLCARKDLEALRELMLGNEGIADQDNAAALAWLMQACHPASFAVGASSSASEGSRAPLPGRAGKSGVAASRGQPMAVLEDKLDDATEVGKGAGREGAGVAGEDEVTAHRSKRLEVAEKGLMWVLLERFRGRMMLALTAPLQDGAAQPRGSPDVRLAAESAPYGGQGSQDTPFAEDEEGEEAAGHQSGAHEHGAVMAAKKGLEGRRMQAGADAPSSMSPATKMLAGVTSGWQKLKSSSRPKSLNSIRDHLKDAMHRAHERTSDLASLVASPASAASPFTPRRHAPPASNPSRSTPTPTLAMALMTPPMSLPGAEPTNPGSRTGAGGTFNGACSIDMSDGMKGRAADDGSRDVAAPADISTVFFSDKWGVGGGCGWQERAPQLLGRRLLGALRCRSQRLQVNRHETSPESS